MTVRQVVSVNSVEKSSSPSTEIKLLSLWKCVLRSVKQDDRRRGKHAKVVSARGSVVEELPD